MGLKDDLDLEVKRIFREQWTVAEGEVIPEPKDVGLSNDAVHFERATVLYADISGFTEMVNQYCWYFAAQVYRSYLFCAARLIRDAGGDITAYDGDRIMGVFIGDSQSSSAARCALKINYAAKEIINPAIKAQYSRTEFKLRQVVGIDTTEIRVARTGVRGDNDLVWIGRAANYAAKLTELDDSYPTWITDSVFQKLSRDSKYSNGGDLMWEKRIWAKMDNMVIHRSNWIWRF
jgi:class 3 adenylate cyclase